MNKWLTMVVCALACWVALAAKQAPNMADYDWYDGTQLTIEGTAFADGETPYCRLPKTAKGKVPDAVFGMSRHATGVNVRFVPKGRKLMFKWVVANPSVVDAFMGPTAMTGLDVYRQDRDGSWKFAANPRYFFYAKDADGNDHGGEYAMDWDPGRPCMVYLPLRSLVRSFKVGVEKGAKIEPMPRHPVSRRIVHYGTSIVHGGCVSRPGMAFAAQEGRLADVEVINHGYSGSGKMEMSMCEVVSSIDAALYVIDCDWNMPVELQKQNYEPFVRELRRRRPGVPILLCGGCTQSMKPRAQEVFARSVYEKLRTEDPVLWEGLSFIGGVDMLPKDGEATFDFCHPNDWGSMQMGRVYAEAIKKALAQGGK